MYALEYKDLFVNQNHDAERNRKRFSLIGLGSFFSFLSLNKLLNWVFQRLNTTIAKQLLQMKGLAVTLEDEFEEVKDTNLNEIITLLNTFLNSNISFHTYLEELHDKGKSKKYPSLLVTKDLVAETIETAYNIIRILKRANIKPNIETSELAIELSRTSINSSERSSYDR